VEICTHCAEQVHVAVFDENAHAFCCRGCLTVYEILQANGLGEYYQIKNSGGIFRKRGAIQLSRTHFQYLDDPNFLHEYTTLNERGERVISFYLEGIHCLACLWLIEKLPLLAGDVLEAKLDMEKSIVGLTMKPEGKLAQAALALDRLGYRPHPLKQHQTSELLKQKEERLQLLRIGVAAAGASNIMLYAVSIYGGANGNYAAIFNVLTILFALPVLSFSAWPFYRAAWLSLRNREMSIDVPISLALLSGAAMGLYSELSGVHENYFDSLTALVFLLLLSRYFLKRIQDKALAVQDLHFFYHNDSVRKSVDSSHESFSSIHPQFLKVGDVIQLKEEDFIPADGIILRGSVRVNASLLTGESEASRHTVGDAVFAGTQVVHGDVLVRVDKVSQDTRIGEILKRVEDGWSQKAPIVEVTQKISSYFVWTVCFLALTLFIKLSLEGSLGHAVEQMITLLIVTCPCALALATPLTFTRALGLAASKGVVIKNDAVLEKLSHIEKVYFDKTGTLTKGRPAVVAFEAQGQCWLPIQDVLLSLERQSKHPIAHALCDYALALDGKILEVENFEEKIGHGVTGQIEGLCYSIHSYQVFQGSKVLAKFTVRDSVRDEAAQTVATFIERGLQVGVISGDKASIVHEVAEKVGISPSSVFAEVSPEEKNRMILEDSNVLLVGDGANDAMALTSADVGVAVCGSADISLRAADVYLLNPGLESLGELHLLSQETMKIIRRNLVLSLSYNAVSVIAVFSGMITPLVAAIIMPMSSLTVLLSTIWGTKKQRSLWKS
jgi:heavy metal-(Cd/Co/Hg/Pb/Zn)-translocating P-type ATPase